MSSNDLGLSLQAAVVVPLYKVTLTREELFALKNNLKVLSARSINVICPISLAESIAAHLKCSGVNKFKIIPFSDKYFRSVEDYNHLLISEIFYDKFRDYSHILICQTDAVVFSDCLDEWMLEDYSYVGAPWFKGMSKPVYPLTFYGVGNGGLSLRRVHDFIEFLSVPRRLSIPPEFSSNRSKLATFFIDKLFFRFNKKPFLPRFNEDIFWGILVPLVMPSFTVPEPLRAADFSFEFEPALLYELKNNKLPFGCHAWEKYDKSFWVKIFTDNGMNYTENAA